MARNYGSNNSSTGCLAAAIIGLIIIAVVISLAVYVFTFLLGIIMLISGVVGTVHTVRNYIVALRSNIPSYAHIAKPNGWIIPDFLYKCGVIGWETIKEAWGYNIDSVKNFFSQVGLYPIVSFKKWIYLFSGISVLIFGSLASVFIGGLYLYLILSLLVLAVAAFAAALVIFGLIGLGVSAAAATTNYFMRVSESYSGAATILSAYVTQCGYREYGQIIRNYCIESITYIRDGFAAMTVPPFFSLLKWVRLGSSFMTIFVGSIMLVIFAAIHIVVLSLLFVFFSLLSVFHR